MTAICDLRVDEVEEAEEESGSYTDEEGSENQALLPNGTGPILYRTISRQSDAEHLPPDSGDLELAKGSPHNDTAGVYATLSVLLLGVFISQTDQSFVLATYGKLSSEFNDLDSGSWLLSAYILAQCVAQPLYGKLSDIYGRKSCLQASYVLFALGTAGSGLGRSLGQVIASRAVQGVGGAGMISMVSIIITDLVPLHEVVSLRSYVNILQTTGRSCGGVIGGLLTEALGWRLAFIVQIPPVLLAIALVQWRLSLPAKDTDTDEPRWTKLKRVDFVGAFFLCLTIFAAAFLIDMAGQKLAWTSPLVIVVAVLGVTSAVLFVVTARKVKEPIFPLRLATHYDLITNYIIVWLQVMVQLSLMMAVPLYFQATRQASTAAAGGYLIPAFVGNTLGGLATGYWIRRTGHYKAATILAPVLSICCMAPLLLTWNGTTSVLESTFILPGGFAMGIVSSSAFVGATAAVTEDDMAVAGSGMYLFFNIGAIAGASAGGAVYQAALRPGLKQALDGIANQKEIVQRLLEDIEYLREMPKDLWQLLIPAYVHSFCQVNCMYRSFDVLPVRVLTMPQYLVSVVGQHRCSSPFSLEKSA